MHDEIFFVTKLLTCKTNKAIRDKRKSHLGMEIFFKKKFEE